MTLACSVGAVFVLAHAAGALKLTPSSEASTAQPREQKQVWVHGFARSGSSTVLSMATEAARVAKGGKVFALFEPCHPKDELAPEFEKQGCRRQLQSLYNCDFSQVKKLNGWNDVHSKTDPVGPHKFTPDKANSACSAADVIVYKTVTRALNSFSLDVDALPLMRSTPNLKVVDIIRDPRSIYASWMHTWPFNDTKMAAGVSRNSKALTDICDTFARNMEVNLPNLHRLHYENLATRPQEAMDRLCEFLEVDCGDEQKKWVKDNFDNKDCHVDKWIAAFSDCHQSSTEPITRWKSILTDEEKKAFHKHEACRTIAQSYNYELDPSYDSV